MKQACRIKIQYLVLSLVTITTSHFVFNVVNGSFTQYLKKLKRTYRKTFKPNNYCIQFAIIYELYLSPLNKNQHILSIFKYFLLEIFRTETNVLDLFFCSIYKSKRVLIKKSV